MVLLFYYIVVLRSDKVLGTQQVLSNVSHSKDDRNHCLWVGCHHHHAQHQKTLEIPKVVMEWGDCGEGGLNILGPRTTGPQAYESCFLSPTICRCVHTQCPGPYPLSAQDRIQGSEPTRLPEGPAKLFSLRTPLPESVPRSPEGGVQNRRHHSWEGRHMASRTLTLQAQLRGGWCLT